MAAQRFAVQLRPRRAVQDDLKDTVLFGKRDVSVLAPYQPCSPAGRETHFYRAGQDHDERMRRGA
jgi:hypothetical protein